MEKIYRLHIVDDKGSRWYAGGMTKGDAQFQLVTASKRRPDAFFVMKPEN